MNHSRMLKLACLLTLTGAALAGCASSGAQRELRQEYYQGQIQLYSSLQVTMYNLSREYGVLQQEYRAAGRPELAEAARQRSAQFAASYKNMTLQKASYERRLAELARGEEPQVQAAAPAPAPAPAAPAPQQPSAAELVAPQAPSVKPAAPQRVTTVVPSAATQSEQPAPAPKVKRVKKTKKAAPVVKLQPEAQPAPALPAAPGQ